jgi:2-oxoglutarate ferredoxin oxidoreductase subunit alpha
MNAGQGEFPRFIVAPGDAEEAYFWSAVAMNLAWKFQVPSFILSDKTVSESQYSFDLEAAGELKEEEKEGEEEALQLWDGGGEYSRYRYTQSGVSPLAFPPQKGQVIKADSYVHDEKGITTEDSGITKLMADKRLQKGRSLARELEGYETVKVYGGRARTALLCWGSNKGVCREAAERLSLRVIQVLVLSPFPEKSLREAVQGVERLIAVECNATGQLASLAGFSGIAVQDRVLKYDGRPFSLEDLLADLGRVLA